MIRALISRLSLWWLRDLLMAHRQAAIINMNTLKAGTTGIITNADAIRAVIVSLEHQILAIESILNITVDD